MITAVSGIRDINPISAHTVQTAVAVAMLRSRELVFGGARGADTIALRAAGILREGKSPRLRVILPGRFSQQPLDARWVIEQFADDLIELKLPIDQSWSYLRRNNEMLRGVDHLLAFTDGRRGGTQYTIDRATEKGIRTRVVRVEGQ